MPKRKCPERHNLAGIDLTLFKAALILEGPLNLSLGVLHMRVRAVLMEGDMRFILGYMAE